MAITYSLRRTTAEAVFAVEDAHARRRLAGALHPAPLGRVDFRVLGPRIGGVLQPFPERTTMVLVRTDSGFSAFAREVSVQMEDGRPVRRRLRDGTYVVQVTSDFYQQLPNFDLPLPNPGAGAPQPINLEPGFNYPFPNGSPLRRVVSAPDCTSAQQSEGRGPTLLRGSLHGPDGAPVEEAVISVDGLADPRYRTDKTGQWVLVFPDVVPNANPNAPPTAHPTGPVTVRGTTPAGVPLFVAAGVCVVRGRETSLRETALRGYVLQGGVGVEGATIAVAGRPQRATTAADGAWFVYFGLDQAQVSVNLTATLPAGQQMPANNIPVTPRATNVVPTFQFP